MDIYRQIFESTPDAFLVVDQDGRINQLNHQAERMFGYCRQELLGQPIETLVPRGFGTRSFDVAARRKDASDFPVDIRSVPMAWAGATHVLCMVRDITDRKQADQRVLESLRDEAHEEAEEELRQSHAHLEASQHIARVGSWELELASLHDSDWNASRWSPECFRLFGYESGDLDSQTAPLFWERVHPDDERGVREEFYRAVAAGAGFEVEHRILLPDGSVRHIHERAEMIRDPKSGQPLRFIGTAQDVTEQRQAEQALRESEAKLRSVVEGMPILLVAFDEQDTPVAWNQECERVTGYLAEEIVGNQRARELLLPDETYREWAIVSFRNRRNSRAQSFILTCKDGTQRTIDWSSVSDRLPIPGWVRWSVGVDVTERLSLEEELRQAQKMQALGQLAGGVAHDFNNLLTVINGYSDMLFHSLAGHKEWQQKADQIRKAGSSAAAITDQLLAFSQNRVVQPEIVDLNKIVNDSNVLLKQLLGDGVSLELGLAEGLYPVLATVTAIQQVLVNLAANARDAMPVGGRLVIQTANDVRPSGSYVRLTIEDSGEGIPQAMLGKIFEPFFTTKETGKGTGLGLSTVYGLVKQRGGWVDVESKPGQGATFHVYLPASQEPAPAPAAGVSKAERFPITILLAEDEAGVRELCASVLEACGSTVLVASGGEEALQIARQYNGRIDLLLSDIAMPKVTGPQLFEQLQQGGRAVPVLFISGYPNEAVQLGSGMELLAKPFLPDQLLEAVARTLKSGSRSVIV